MVYNASLILLIGRVLVTISKTEQVKVLLLLLGQSVLNGFLMYIKLSLRDIAIILYNLELFSRERQKRFYVFKIFLTSLAKRLELLYFNEPVYLDEMSVDDFVKFLNFKFYLLLVC